MNLPDGYRLSVSHFNRSTIYCDQALDGLDLANQETRASLIDIIRKARPCRGCWVFIWRPDRKVAARASLDKYHLNVVGGRTDLMDSLQAQVEESMKQ